MAVSAASNNGQLQLMLQSAVQAVQWTYSLFWQFCPQQGILVWAEGYYNGAIKTRKTVQSSMEVRADEVSLQRSQQLRELYESLSAGESANPSRRPSASLSPEDLTEAEWFYLMCVSFSFPPGEGLPGKAYAKGQHVWLTAANEVDSKVFSRAILAKSARVQTVVCIPLMGGVVEFGYTERVQEDPSFIQQVKSYFFDHYHHIVTPPPPPLILPKPALSEHSTSSNPTPSSSARSHFHSRLAATAYATPSPTPDDTSKNMVGDDDEEDDDDEEEAGSESEAQTQPGLEESANPGPTQFSELMQVEMPEEIRLGSPEDASNNIDSDFPMVAGASSMSQQHQVESFKAAESTRRWPVMQQQPETLSNNDFQPLLPGDICGEDEEASETGSGIGDL